MPDFDRILVVRTDRLGDVVLTLPLLPVLRRHFPQAHLAMLVGRYAGGIVEGNAYVDRLLWYDNDRGLVPFRTMLSQIRAGRFDACVVVHPTARLAWLMFLARIPVRVGSGYRLYSLLFNRRVYTHRKTAERHEAEYNLELLTSLGCPPASGEKPVYSLSIPAEAEASLALVLAEHRVGGRYVVLHPGSGGSAHEWPPGHFAELAVRLHEVCGVAVVVTGSSGESALGGEVVRHTGGRAVSLCGVLTLKELAALLKHACLVISNSTGPLHMAVALETPVVGFYSQIPVMGPRRWGPYSQRARILVPDRQVDCTECRGRAGTECACMASISVDAALLAAQELLTGNPVSLESLGHEP